MALIPIMQMAIDRLLSLTPDEQEVFAERILQVLEDKKLQDELLAPYKDKDDEKE